MGKATNVKFRRYIQRVHANKSRLKFWEKMERGRIQGLSKFFECPLLSQERVKLRTSNLADISQGPCEQKPLKNLGEYGAWANPATPQLFEVPPIISGMGKATNVKFGRYIQRVHANKSWLKIGRKWSVGVYRDCPNFWSTPYYLRNG